MHCYIYILDDIVKKSSFPWSKNPSKVVNISDIWNVGYHQTLSKDMDDKKLSSTSSSTISLHIDAYERSIKETDIVCYEFPRQQPEKNQNSEVVHFKASQKLLHVNKPQAIKTKKKTKEASKEEAKEEANEEEKKVLLISFKKFYFY